MSLLDLYGLVCVMSMMVFYALERRHRHWTLAFAVGCVFSSSYGFLEGAWPFGIAEGVWALVALKKWRSLCSSDGPLASQASPARSRPRP